VPVHALQAPVTEVNTLVVGSRMKRSPPDFKREGKRYSDGNNYEPSSDPTAEGLKH
jgi:hypothetical protein